MTTNFFAPILLETSLIASTLQERSFSPAITRQGHLRFTCSTAHSCIQSCKCNQISKLTKTAAHLEITPAHSLVVLTCNLPKEKCTFHIIETMLRIAQERIEVSPYETVVHPREVMLASVCLLLA